MNSRYKNLIKSLFVLALLYFVGRQVYLNWDELVSYEWTFDIWWFTLSAVAHLMTLVLFSRVWCLLIDGFGYQVPLKYGFKISYITNLGRYIPGKIWPVFGMVHYAKQVGVREESALTSWIVAQLFALPAAFLASLIGILLYPDLLLDHLSFALRIGVIVLAAVTFLISIVLVTAPAKLLFLLNKVLTKVGRKTVTFEMTSAKAVQVYLGYIISWGAYGLSFWLFLHAILPNPGIGLAEAATAFVLAYQLGYVALFAPGGIGIRELILTGVLAPFVGPIAAGVALAARFWNLAIEIVSAFIALSIKTDKREEGNEETEK
ncbi:MAG: lysylphosphatidylglycerol synthase transmembrane domain-containing protein [bacterium]|nr:lysylphosphatidylglycerol synthase transmembrane domain-containing protein [bacterium]